MKTGRTTRGSRSWWRRSWRRTAATRARARRSTQVVALLKERVSTLKELADAAVYFYRPLEAHEELKKQHYLAEVKPALDELAAQFSTIEWNAGRHQ